MTRIDERGTTLAITSNHNARCEEILTKAIGCIIPEDGILHSHSGENIKSYKAHN
jgi:hypothetical protein